MRLLRGDELDAISRELGVTASMLSSWRDSFLFSGQAGLKTQAVPELQDQTRDLKALIGELTIDNECLSFE